MKNHNVPIWGTLIIGENAYYLLHPRPLSRFKDDWMPEGTHIFYVCGTLGPGSSARHLVVKGDWSIDYASAGKIVEIRMDNQLLEQMLREEASPEKEASQEPEWLKNEFKRSAAAVRQHNE